LKTLCGQEGQELSERVICAASHKERVILLTQFLTRKLNTGQERYHKIISCIQQVINSSHMETVASLAEECNYSRKQFERKFKEYSGFSPKHFLILTRFRNALKTHRQTDTLSQLAVRCGYFDQAHFIHDFHKLSGHNPRDFFQQHSDIADFRLTRAS
jgi:transcriptional regulator GlxA family with amidase domain